MYRSPEGVQFVTGTLKRKEESEKKEGDEEENKHQEEEDTLEDFYRGEIEEGNVEIVKELSDVYLSMMEILKKRSTMAIQDDWRHWNKAGEIPSEGKLMLVDQADYHTH